MKTKKSIIAYAWILLAIFAWSCNEGDDPINPQDQNVVADNLLVNSNSALDRMRSSGIGGPMGALFGNFQSSNGRSDMTPSTMLRTRGRAENDSTDTTTPSCLVETWEDDGNGNFTYTLDFGDGCDYYGEFLKGKLVEKGSYNESSFSSTTTYTNFGGQDWTIDGTTSYSGTWEETESNTSEPADTAVYDFNASYEFSADLKTSYMEYGHDSTSEVSTGERLIEVDYEAQGSEEVDQDSYIVKTRTESVEISSGESFQSQVDTPLFYDFNCEDDGVWIFVSGKESGSYTFGDQSGTYSIDYGSGACDNIVTVTENGVSEEVDLGEVWDDWEEECEKEG